MITNIKDYLLEKAKNPNFNKINEDFEEEEFNSDNEENETEENEGLTFDSFKEAIIAEHDRLQAETEEAEFVAPEVPTDEQLNMIFTVVETLIAKEDENEESEETEEEEAEEESDENEEEHIEEGLGDFLRGGSKDEIEEKKKVIVDKLAEIENKYNGKTLFFQEFGDNKTIPYNNQTVLNIIAKNNYLGTIQVMDKGDKIYLLYREGKKGLNKIAAGTSAQTAGA